MFTGIITACARVVSNVALSGQGGLRLELARWRGARMPGSDPDWSDLSLGESIAVDGTCLTLVATEPEVLAFEVVAETVRRTQLGRRAPGEYVNLERSLRLGDRIGGHWVSGHVDAVGRILAAAPPSPAAGVMLRIEVQDRQDGDPFRVIPKGSVAVNGVSLTIVNRDEREFSVALIPHTLGVTNLGDLRPGDLVNLESDMIGKWVREWMSAAPRR